MMSMKYSGSVNPQNRAAVNTEKVMKLSELHLWMTSGTEDSDNCCAIADLLLPLEQSHVYAAIRIIQVAFPGCKMPSAVNNMVENVLVDLGLTTRDEQVMALSTLVAHVSLLWKYWGVLTDASARYCTVIVHVATSSCWHPDDMFDTIGCFLPGVSVAPSWAATKPSDAVDMHKSKLQKEVDQLLSLELPMKEIEGLTAKRKQEIHFLQNGEETEPTRSRYRRLLIELDLKWPTNETNRVLAHLPEGAIALQALAILPDPEI
jgi:hypothetical protein